MSAQELFIVGGPNGAGKTTIALEYAAEKRWPYLSADAIAQELVSNDPASVRITAGLEFIRRFDFAINGDESLIIESTLAGRTLQRRISTASALSQLKVRVSHVSRWR